MWPAMLTWPHLFLAESLAHPEDVPIGMPHMRLPDTPWHVGRRPGDFEALLSAMPVHRVNIFRPDRHPDTLVADLVAIGAEGLRVAALPVAALRALAQEDLAVARADAAPALTVMTSPSGSAYWASRTPNVTVGSWMQGTPCAIIRW
jgi:hypothetical protein